MEKNAEKDFKHLVRIANTDVDGKKQIVQALLKIKGIGFMYSNAICTVASIDKRAKAGYLTDEQVNKLTEVILNPTSNSIPSWMFNRRKDVETGEDKHLITADLDFTKGNDIKMMKKIRSYKGVRHSFGLPVRGQRTKANFRKNKGKVSLGVQRKKVGAPDAKKDSKGAKGGKGRK
jgi:small subunit ribosomal protein S13